MKAKLHRAFDTISIMQLNNLKRKQILSQHLKNNLTDDEIQVITTSILQVPPTQRNQTDLDILSKATEKISFFKNLEETNGRKCLMNCLKYLVLEKFEEDEIVFYQGEFGTKFYIILSGTVEIYVKQRGKKDQLKVNSLSNGAAFGELALINDAPRMATVKTITPSQFGVLQKHDYKEILAKEQARQLESRIFELQSIPTLDKLSRKGLQMLIYTFELRSFKYSQIVYREGDLSDDLIYIIRDGEFKIIKNIMKSSKEINELKSKSNKLIKLELCIIGKDTTFGEEEPFSKLPNRQFTVQCNSLVAQTYVVSLNEMKKRISLSNEQHVITFMQSLNEYKSRWRKILTLKMAQIHTKVKRSSSKSLQRPRTSRANNEQINMQSSQQHNSRCVSATSFYQNIIEFKSTLNLQEPQREVAEEGHCAIVSREVKRQRKNMRRKYEVKKMTKSNNGCQLTPEQMRKIHDEFRSNKRVNYHGGLRPESFQRYLNQSRQQQDSIRYESLNQEQGQTIYQTIQSSQQPNNPYRTVQQTHVPVQFQNSENQNLNLTIAPKHLDLRDNSNNKVDLVKKRKSRLLDTSLIVDSRYSVLSRFKQKRSVSLQQNAQGSQQNPLSESIVYVPCGVTRLRAKQWPIRADLFVMKMNKQEDKLQNTTIEDVKEKYAVSNLMKSERPQQDIFMSRIQNMTYRYQPNHAVKNLQNEYGFVKQFH